MDQRPTGQAETPVTSLAELTFDDHTIDSVMAHVGRLALGAMEGWDVAAASLVTGKEIATYGATDATVDDVDQAQYDSDKGPCVDALKTGEIQYFDGTSDEPRWRQFAEAAADSGIYSTLSFPLRLNDEVIGALNLYSRERDAVRPGHREEGQAFAAHASVTISNLRSYLAKNQQVGQLEDGLKTRTIIGQATGLLMAREGLTSEQAFQKLVHTSQNANLKLRDIAQRYVQAWEQRAPLAH